MRALGAAAEEKARVYLTGGASAVLIGRDVTDAREIFRRGLVEPDRLRVLFAAIEPRLYRFPAIEPATFRRAVEEFLAEATSDSQLRAP